MENRNRDDEFATHYYGNERDLRERDRIARAERMQRDEMRREAMRRNERRKRSAKTVEEHDRMARESDIGREPYEPSRRYHRAHEDSMYSPESSRRNWRQLYNDFFSDFTTLFRKESELIRTELGEKATLVRQGAITITTGTIVAFVGVQCIAATVIIALGNIMSWWLAALVTGLALLLIGMAMMAAARRKLSSDNLTPYRSMESFDHMGHMLKEKRDEFTRH